MSVVKRSMFVVAVLLSCTGVETALAQWEGKLQTEGVWNFQQSNSELIDFQLKYSGKKSFFSTGLTWGHKYSPSAQTTSILDAKKKEDEFYKGESKAEHPENQRAGIHLDFGHTFNDFNFLKASIGYKYEGTGKKSELQTERYNADGFILKGVQTDTSRLVNHRIDGRLVWQHRFSARPAATFDMELTGATDFDLETNWRNTTGNFF